MISSVPAARVSSRTASWYSGSGSTMPMLVSAGSKSTAATSPGASAARRPSMSLISTTFVVSATGTAGPMLPSRATTEPSSANCAKVSSTDP